MKAWSSRRGRRVPGASPSSLPAQAVRREMARRLAGMDEAVRARFARILHDGVAQGLTVLGLHLHKVLAATGGDGRQRESVLEAISTLEDLAVAVREVMDGMRLTILYDHGLGPALRACADRCTARTGVPVSFHMVAEPQLAPATEIALFRIVEEALANVARHASAGEVVISVDIRPDSCVVGVADNGTGFDPAEAGKRGNATPLGIIIMRNRAEAIGGSCRIESSPGKGTRVLVEVPR